MNQYKLRSLMFHAGFCNEDGGWDNRPIWEQEHDNFQRFAELIVEECLDLVDRGGEFVSRPKLVERIKEHFGVEE